MIGPPDNIPLENTLLHDHRANHRSHIPVSGSDDPAKTIRSITVRQVVTDINPLSARPDLVIHTGDLARHRTRAEYLFLRDPLSELDMSYYVIPGNRDVRHLLDETFSGVTISSGYDKFIHYCVEG